MRAIADAARQVGWGQGYDLGITVAQMLAVASTQQPEMDSVRRLLFDETIELPQSKWADIVKQYEKTVQRLTIVGPPISYPFGVIDRIRREVIGLDAVRAGEAIPLTLVQSVLDLSAGRVKELPSLSHSAQLLIADGLGIGPGEQVLCADIGAAGLALFLVAERHARVCLEVEDQLFANIFAWLALAAGTDLDVFFKNIERSRPVLLRQEGSSLPPNFADFDALILYPPFGSNQPREVLDERLKQTGLTHGSSPESMHVMRAAKKGQRSACIVPGGYLFRTTKSEQIFKEAAILRYGLNAVVALPREALGRNTAIPTSLLLFRSHPDRRRDGSVLMVDARATAERDVTWALDVVTAVQDREDGPISALVSLQQIATQDFNLTVDRYVLDPEARRARNALADTETRLEDVAELYRPQSLAAGAGSRGQLGDDARPLFTGMDERLFEVGVADIDEAGIVRQPGKELASTLEVVQRSRKARLEAGDVLLVIKGSAGKVGFVRTVPDNEAWLASQSFVVASVRRGGPVSDPHVLFRFLSSSVGQAALRSLIVGSTIPGLQMADVRRLPVLVPSRAIQADVTEEVQRAFEAQDRALKLRKDAMSRLSHVWPDGQATRAMTQRRGRA